MTEALTYRRRLDLLRETKRAQTHAKLRKNGYMDEDDYGTVLPPDDFHWEPTPTHPNGSWYGAEGWARNFRSLMEVHPTYVDPLDALAGRWMIFMNRERPVCWPPDLDYAHLVPDQERYGIEPGIGADAHFTGDYLIGLKLGWGGLLQKVRHYRQVHAGDAAKAALLDAEEQTVLGVQTWIRRTVEAVRDAEAAETHADLRQNLHETAEANAWLLDHPPRTLREACQRIATGTDAAWATSGPGAYRGSTHASSRRGRRPADGT